MAADDQREQDIERLDELIRDTRPDLEVVRGPDGTIGYGPFHSLLADAGRLPAPVAV